MDGHFDQAAAALTRASEATPVEHLAEATEQLDAVVALAREAGGMAGEHITAAALAAQDRLREETHALLALRDQLTAAASHALLYDG